MLYKLVKRLKEVLAERRRIVREGDGDSLSDEDGDATAMQTNDQFHLEGGGFLIRSLKFLFKTIDRPWKMYPLGVVFGLGFDTSSEIAVLGIASIQAVQGTSIWLILIFPILFTCKSFCSYSLILLVLSKMATTHTFFRSRHVPCG